MALVKDTLNLNKVCFRDYSLNSLIIKLRRASTLFMEWHRFSHCSVSSLWREGRRMHRPTFLLSQAWKTSEIGIISCIKLPSESAQPQRTSSCTASQAFQCVPFIIFCTSLWGVNHLLHGARLMNAPPPLFFTAIFEHVFCRHGNCHGNTLKRYHSQRPTLRQLNVPIKSFECSSFPYHKKPDAILLIHGSNNTCVCKYNDLQLSRKARNAMVILEFVQSKSQTLVSVDNAAVYTLRKKTVQNCTFPCHQSGTLKCIRFVLIVCIFNPERWM